VTPPKGTVVEQLRREFYAGLLTLDETREALGISQYYLDKLVEDGQLRTVRVGTTTYIGHGVVRSYIAAAHGTAVPIQYTPTKTPKGTLTQ